MSQAAYILHIRLPICNTIQLTHVFSLNALESASIKPTIEENKQKGEKKNKKLQQNNAKTYTKQTKKLNIIFEHVPCNV